MLRRILLASNAVVAFAGTAFAADLTPPPPPPPPVPVWTGFYAGVNAGYEWAADRSVNTFAAPVFAAPAWSTELALSTALATGSNSLNPNGFIGGGQIGYNYQLFTTNWVAGIEGDIQGIAGSRPSSSFSGSGVPADLPGETIVSTVTSTKQLNYLGTVRGRFGYLLMPALLIYGDGGLAYGGVKASTGILQANMPFAPPFASGGSLSNTQVGWSAGIGLEWMFLPNWSLKAEYLYYDLGKVTYTLSPLAFSSPTFGSALLYASAPFSSTRFNGSVVRAGINYHFNWGAPAPIVAKY
ncbi:MAG TPA: outer membrane beta-barrel protein [Methylocella sp.]|nr:outer membrane beta-barrel protein [Methylocella sp.]